MHSTNFRRENSGKHVASFESRFARTSDRNALNPGDCNCPTITTNMVVFDNSSVNISWVIVVCPTITPELLVLRRQFRKKRPGDCWVIDAFSKEKDPSLF